MKNNYSPLENLAKQIKSNEAYLLCDPHSLKYFSDCKTLLPEEREAYLIINPKQSYLIQSSFSPKNNHQDIKTLFGMSPAMIQKNLAQVTRELELTTLFINKDSLFVTEYEWLKQINNQKLIIKNINKNLIWDLRIIKSKEEIIKIKKASHIASQAVKNTLASLKVGTTELEIKNQIIKEFHENGANGEAFPTIVAFGANSALPHHQPTNTKLKLNMPVLIDCGTMYEGYRSDMTRTVYFGKKKSDKFLEIEKIVMAAYDAAKTRCGDVETRLIASLPITAADLDHAARSIITTAGYGDKFIHTTGHGVGLEIHELPSLNFNNQQLIKPGMVITIEPGIYLEGEFGYRHENTILIKEKDVEELTK